jgi:integrase
MLAPTPVHRLSFAPPVIRGIPTALVREGKFPVRFVAAKKVWEVDVRPHGRIRSVTFPGSLTPMKLLTREMAAEVRRLILADIEKGVPEKVAVSPYLPRESLLEKWVERWLEHLDEQVERGARSPTYTRRLRDFADPKGQWGSLYGQSIHSIGLNELEGLVRKLRKAKASETTIVHVLASLRTCLRWVEERSNGAFVAPKFPQLQRAAFEPAILTREQQAAVLDAIPEEKRGAFLAMADLMIRPGEARGANVGDYDFGSRELQVRHAMKGSRKDAVRGTTKGRDRRLLVVTARLAEWLEAHVSAEARLRRDVPLFANPDARGADPRWPESTLRHVWEAASESAGGPQVGLYVGTKHTTSTWLRRAGLSLDELGLAMGHSWASREKQVTEGYARPPRVANETIVRLLDGRGR